MVNALAKFYVLFILKVAKRIVVLTADENIIVRRKQDLISLTKVSYKIRLYKILSKILVLPVVDTNYRTIGQTFEEVATILNLYANKLT